jgi:hypothetical integral membrane protein (TIGR02206 family)
MEPLILLSLSHFLSTLICILVIIYLPRYFINAAESKKNIFKLALLILVIINDGFDFYKTAYISENPWQRGLPLHMCDFSAYSILAYLFTKIRIFFVFAFFWGILGAGFALLTPDVIYGFPHFEYIQSHIGHSFILIGVSFALQVDNQKVIAADPFKILAITTILLAAIYVVNSIIGRGANYWYVNFKPEGDSIMNWMRPEPYHMIDIYILAIVLCYLLYFIYYLFDKKNLKSNG